MNNTIKKNLKKEKGKEIDIDMNKMLGIDDDRWTLICEKMNDILQDLSEDPRGLSVQDFIKDVSELDFGPKEMFLLGMTVQDFLKNVGKMRAQYY